MVNPDTRGTITKGLLPFTRQVNILKTKAFLFDLPFGKRICFTPKEIIL